MIIVGAKGFAKELLEDCLLSNNSSDIKFYDDVSQITVPYLFDVFYVIRTQSEAKDFINYVDKRFTLGLGGPNTRKLMFNKFTQLGGIPVSTLSNNASVGKFGTTIGDGSNIMAGVRITNSVGIGKGVLINLNSTIGHDTLVGDFVEICPNVSISGNCIIGQGSFIGTGSIILPNVKVGEGAIVGAGSVVTKDVMPYTLVFGNPAKFIRELIK